jgi:restriction endonuclease S subunit
MESEKLGEVASVTAGTSPKGELINSQGLGLPFFQGTKEFGDLFPTAERFTEHPVRVAKKGEILIGVRAPVGEVNFALEDSAIGRGVMAVNAKNPQHVNFLFYFLKNLQGKWDSLGSTGSVFENLSASTLREISVPEGLHKRQVGDVLLNIDLKIQANRLLSKTLEGIAETVFKSWFIDFDPVRAKIAGERPVGVGDETSSLFPDSLVDSELGVIPRAWDVRPIGEVLSVSGGTTPSTSNPAFWDGEHFWTTPKDLSKQSGLITTGSARSLTDDGLRQISSGLLPIHSVLMSCRAPIGYLSINAVPTAVNQGFITMKKDEFFSPLYVLFWIRANMNEILSRAGGGTFAEITRKAFKEIPFIKPPQEILSAYSKLADPILFELESITRENHTLLALRDSLLPRLVSGELQIPDEMLAS